MRRSIHSEAPEYRNVWGGARWTIADRAVGRSLYGASRLTESLSLP
jgi:hypothetical protein